MSVVETVKTGDILDDRYELTEIVGRGGCGTVFRATDLNLDREVAIKVLSAEGECTQDMITRFERESQILRHLHAPNTVFFYDIGQTPQGLPYIAMEFVSGKQLKDLLDETHALTPEVTVQILIQVFQSLVEAHSYGFVHRDLKPENVFIIKEDDGTEHVKVLDFGFARLQGAAKKLTMAGVAFGTPHYMSPEQAMGLTEITAACDVYALGIMLFQAVSGHVPYDSANNSPMEVMHAQVNSPTPQCVPRQEYNVPKRLISCIYKCMKKEPKDRYADGNELCAELQAILDEIKKASAELEKPTVVAQAVDNVATHKGSGLSQTTFLIAIAALVLIAIIVTILIVLNI